MKYLKLFENFGQNDFVDNISESGTFVIDYKNSDKIDKLVFNPFDNIGLAKYRNIDIENIKSVYNQETAEYVFDSDDHKKFVDWTNLMSDSQFMQSKSVEELTRIYKELKSNPKNSEHFEDLDFYYEHLKNYIKQKYGK